MKFNTAILLLLQSPAAFAGKGSKDSLPTLTDNIKDVDLSGITPGDSCLTLSGFTVSTEHCNFDALSAALEDIISLECPHADGDRELSSIFSGDETVAREQIKQACKNAWDNHKVKYEYPWSEVTRYGEKWDKEYYDGKSGWNEVYETIVDAIDPDDPGNHLKEDAGRVRSLFEGEASYYPLEVPTHLDNFDNCELRSMMCCWTADRQANDNNGNCATPYDDNCVDADPGDNTDLCSVDMSRTPKHNYVDGGFAMFSGDNNSGEGPIHCHGLAWGKDEMDADARYKANNLFFVSMYDHMYQRGYVRNVPGAPMCGCVEKMPKVSRSDCTEIDAEEQWLFTWDTEAGAFSAELEKSELNFNACRGYQNNNNNLEAFYRRLAAEDRVSFEDFSKFKETVVGDNRCQRTIDSDIIDVGFEYVPDPYQMSKYTQKEGSLDSVAISSDAKVQYGLKQDGTLLEYSNGAWTGTNDNNLKFASISLADNGDQLWAVTRTGDVVFRENGDWTEFDRRLMKMVSVSDDGNHVWAINDDNEIFYRAGKEGYWELTEGSLKQLSVNHDGTTIWGVNTNDQIFYRRGLEDSWHNTKGHLSYVSAFGDEGVWAVNDKGEPYTRDSVNSDWTSIGGYLSTVSSSKDKNKMWGVDKFDRVWSFGASSSSAGVSIATTEKEKRKEKKKEKKRKEQEAALAHFYESKDAGENDNVVNVNDPLQYGDYMEKGEQVDSKEVVMEYKEEPTPEELARDIPPETDPQPEVAPDEELIMVGGSNYP